MMGGSVLALDSQVTAASPDFQPPAPGSYTLPDLGDAGDVALLDSAGKEVSLRSLFQQRETLLSFIYTTCSDSKGCPFATVTLSRTAKAIRQHVQDSTSIRFLTISFNPEIDRPEVMAEYRKPFENSGVDWLFLTPRDAKSRDEMLAGYGQVIETGRDEKGLRTPDIEHVVRIFLVDHSGKIRNSYTPSVLYPDLLLADLQTLAMERSPGRSKPRMQEKSALQGKGDSGACGTLARSTRGASLKPPKDGKRGVLGFRPSANLGLPSERPLDHRPRADKVIALGRKLFFDRRLSFNGTLSCAMCHIPEQGFTSQEQATSVGIEGRTVRRNAPTLLNVGYLSLLFHDGREMRLEDQVWGPLLAQNEMGNPSIGVVLARLRGLKDYQGLFESALGWGPSLETVGTAIAQYERTLVAARSPFDLWYYGHESAAVKDDVKRGFALFTGKAGCSACHHIGAKGSLFTDQGFHNTGLAVPERSEAAAASDRVHVQLAPGVFADLDAKQIDSVSESRPSDIGRAEITRNPEDLYKFRTPGLRNVAITAPYMHDGSMATLDEVIDFYLGGGRGGTGIDPLIHPLSLTDQDRKDLIAFLNALTSSCLDPLVEDAHDAPVGDPLGHSQ